MNYNNRFLLKVYRAERYSPNSAERDRAIMDAVAEVLAGRGFDVAQTDEDSLHAGAAADVVLSMARSARALDVLDRMQAGGTLVVNSAAGVRACARSSVDLTMRVCGLPAAPLHGDCGYWLKRGDEAAQGPDDVVFAADSAERDRAMRRFAARGVTDVVVTAHVPGDVVKFYGVAGTGFFRTYHADAGYSKFGDERLNGCPHRYEFDAVAMQADAARLAELTGADVYGGDCIVRADGSYAIIDFNDWPSFARCRAEAAAAIARRVETLLAAGTAE